MAGFLDAVKNKAAIKSVHSMSGNQYRMMEIQSMIEPKAR